MLNELRRVLKPGGMVAMEVGEVRKGTVDLEKSVIRCGVESGFEVLMVLCQEQVFTKTAQCWGVRNNSQNQFAADCSFQEAQQAFLMPISSWRLSANLGLIASGIHEAI